jgi:hypothetical protein
MCGYRVKFQLKSNISLRNIPRAALVPPTSGPNNTPKIAGKIAAGQNITTTPKTSARGQTFLKSGSYPRKPYRKALNPIKRIIFAMYNSFDFVAIFGYH